MSALKEGGVVLAPVMVGSMVYRAIYADPHQPPWCTTADLTALVEAARVARTALYADGAARYDAQVMPSKANEAAIDALDAALSKFAEVKP